MKVYPHLHKETGGKTSQIASTLVQGHKTVHASVLFLILTISYFHTYIFLKLKQVQDQELKEMSL